MQWNTTYQESVFSFANNINTHEGGSHLSGFRSALTTVLNRYARSRGLLKEKDDNLTGEDVRDICRAPARFADPRAAALWHLPDAAGTCLLQHPAGRLSP